MIRRQLNDRLVSALSSGGLQRAEFFDGQCPGLSSRVTRAGRKTWTYTYTSQPSDKRARLVLGTYPATSLREARERAISARATIEQGKDPRLPQPAPRVKTIQELIADRMKLEVRGKLRTADKIQRRYDRHVIPLVGSVAAADFRIAHLNMIIDPIVERGSQVEAKKVYDDMRALMNFAVSRGEIDYTSIARAKAPITNPPRKRFLTTVEIASVWRSLPSILAHSEHVPTVLRLCLVTGQRVGEVVGIRRSEIDFANRVWTLPLERVKNKHEHIVPLSDLAIDLIGEALRETNGDYAFPRKSGENRPLSVTVVDRAVRRAEARFEIPYWTPHDLRRTVGTQMLNKKNGLNIPRFDKHLVLNHRSATKGNVGDEVYDQNEYLDEKREALDKWAGFLARLIGADDASFGECAQAA